MAQPTLNTSPKVTDEIRQTTCYMCACRCGINVHLRDGKVSYIEGNRDHPVNKGVLCAKGSAGIMQHYSPARLQSPMLRVGERGEGKFKPISWDEALELATAWLAPLRAKAPEKLAFFTGRDQSQSFTGWWAQAFGTPNYAAHGGFCSVNMAAAGIYTMGGAFWEFGAPDWDYTKIFMLFGVAEDHDSNPIKMGLGKLKQRGARIIAVNPVRTGYNAIADDWLGITPGTDGQLILALVHCLFKARKIDLPYLLRYTNTPFLVNQDAQSDEFGLFLRDDNGKELVWNRNSQSAVAWDTPDASPELQGDLTVNDIPCKTVFSLMAARYLADEYSPEAVEESCGIAAKTIRRIAGELARVAFEEEVVLDRAWTDWRGKKHDTMVGRPVAFHAMRGISAHSNGFQTCRALHMLQILLGSVETPGGFRFKPPYPKPFEAHPKPHAKAVAGKPLAGPHLGYPRGPEDLAIDSENRPLRIDKAFTWENPLSAHGLMHMVISNAVAGDPYQIDTLFLYMANMAWNSSMNTRETMDMLRKKRADGEYAIPHIIYSDAYSSEMVAFADLVLPDTTYLERHDCISLLDRPIGEPDLMGDAIRWPVVAPDRDVRGFQSVLLDLGARLGLPGMVDDGGAPVYKNYADYIQRHERRPGIGPLAGFRGDGRAKGRGTPNEEQIDAYIENGGFWAEHIAPEHAYFKPWNQGYQDWAVERGLYDVQLPYTFNIYLEPLQKFRLAAQGKHALKPPEHMRDRLEHAMDPLPFWYPPFGQTDGFPLHAITQRPAAMYHSWGSQNAWLRQIHGHNPLYISAPVWNEHGFGDGDWAKLSSPHGEITVPVARMDAQNKHTLWTWNAIGKRRGAWALVEGASESDKGFLLNHLISELLPPQADGHRWANVDPITGQAAWYDLRVKIAKVPAPSGLRSQPDIEPQTSPVAAPPKALAYGKNWI